MPGLALAAAWSAISLAALLWTLSDMTIDRGGGDDAGAANLRNLLPYWLASASCWIGLTGLWQALRRNSQHASGFLLPALTVLVVAVAARVVVILTHQPALSDDIYRYVYDGRNLAHGLNPYLTDPDERLAALVDGHASEREHWRGEADLVRLLAYPEITTPYLPLSQYVFAALGWVCERGDWVTPDSSARVFRVGFVAIETVLMMALLAALRARVMSPWWLALYAWHPLAVSEFAGSGHQDVIGIALLAAALMWASRARPGHARGYVKSMAVLAGSVMVKPLAILAAPIILRGKTWRAWFISIVIGAAVCIALALPLGFWPGQPAHAAWKDTADWMTEKVAHFGGVYEPVLCIVRRTMTGGENPELGFNLKQEWLARKMCLGAFGLVLVWMFIRVRDHWRAVAAALLALTLFSTTCHPWYLLWALALCPLAMTWTLWVYSLTITWGYAVFITGKGHALGVEWTVAPWVIVAAYLPVAIALVADIAIHCRLARAKPQAAAARSADI